MLSMKAVLVVLMCIVLVRATYVIDDRPGLGRRFDGIGAISGGGATSKLLKNYAEPHRSNILDYLFKPGFGASLQILKVEIGGDSQSTDGSESSHMHKENDENYERGYEWWLMKEAKKRNADILLYGLPWVWPGWLGGGKFDPFSNITKTAYYISNWIKGAQRVHHLTIDYIGIWNERQYNAAYIKYLRYHLDKLELQHVQIVAADAGWKIAEDMWNDPDLLNAIDVVGAHYPSSYSSYFAMLTGRPLWASEEFSAFNDLKGGGCWARVLNEGYVNGFLTATIAWNLITSYYDHLPYTRSSLMTANQPWSGSYTVSSPIWMSAHFTQFSKVGWYYLKHGYGVGKFKFNGTYTAMTDGTNLSIFIVTMDPHQCPCFYNMPHYDISRQPVSFKLKGKFKNIKKLEVWHSKLTFGGSNEDDLFIKEADIKVENGSFKLNLDINEVYTLTTVTKGQKGDHGSIPHTKQFPVPYEDNFEGYPEFAEPINFAQQAGAFEVQKVKQSGNSGKAIVQTVPEPPIDTCLPERMTKPVTLIGNYDWSDVNVQVDAFLPNNGSSGVFLGARVHTGGCYTMYSNGIFVWVLTKSQMLFVTGNFTRSNVIASARLKIQKEKWFTLGLKVQGNKITALFDGKTILETQAKSLPSNKGFIALGTEEFSEAFFDNFKIKQAKIYGQRLKSSIRPTDKRNFLKFVEKLKTKKQLSTVNDVHKVLKRKDFVD